MIPTVAGEVVRGDLKQRIEATGNDLRGAISAVLEAVAGPQPRPARVSRAIGLDKSLSSRLVRAVQNASDLELMHLVPSPGGLHIFAELAMRYADPASISNLLAATQRFELLIDTLPGGRASIDAQISESSQVALAKREQIAKQASFKAMSFLLGHFCDVLSTTLFLVPSADPGRVDGIEIQRRIGLRRMRPSTPLALVSFWSDPEDKDAVSFDTLDGERGSSNPAGFLLPAFCTQPLGEFDIVRQGHMTTLVLAGGPAVHTPSQLTSVFRIRNGWPIAPEQAVDRLLGYVLTTPCRQGVREVYIADSLYPDATPQLSFVLPGPPESKRPPREDGSRHFSEVDLTHAIEQRPIGRQSYEIPGVVNHSAVVRHVLERAGHGMTRFRGWRCVMTYPVPLVETVWWLAHPSLAAAKGDGDRRG